MQRKEIKKGDRLRFENWPARGQTSEWFVFSVKKGANDFYWCTLSDEQGRKTVKGVVPEFAQIIF